MLLFTLFVSLLLVVLVYIKWQRNKAKYASIPGYEQFLPPPLAELFGKIVPFYKPTMPMTGFVNPSFVHREHKPICKIVSMGLTVVSVCDVEFTKYMTKNDTTLFSVDIGLGIAEFFKEYFGNNVASAMGKDWHRQRLLLNQCFTDKALTCVHDSTFDVMTRWMELLKKNNRRNMSEELTPITTDVIGKAAFGYDFGLVEGLHTSSEKPAFADAIHEIFANMFLVITLPKFIREAINFGPIARVKKAVKFFNSQTANIVAKRRKMINEGHPAPNDLLSVMINATAVDENDTVAPLTDEELAANCFIFMSAGQETTAKSLQFVFYHLCKNEHVLKKAQSIVDKVLGDRDVEYADVEDLQYLEWIVKEALRMNPPSSGVAARAPLKDIKYKDYTIPKGTMIFFSGAISANDDEYFPNAAEFKPERWESGNHNRYAFLTFGIGHRNCIGMKFAYIEQVLILAMLLQKYDMKLDADYGPLETKVVVQHRPAKDVWVTFTPRVK